MEWKLKRDTIVPGHQEHHNEILHASRLTKEGAEAKATSTALSQETTKNRKADSPLNTSYPNING